MSHRITIPCPTGPPWDGGRSVIATLEAAGHEAWFVGGCVRDLILDQPVHDADVTTSAHPDQVEALFPHTVAVGRSFGVVVVVLADGQHVEVATFRNDGAYVDGRRPTTVTYGTVVEDVERRDFTINGLLLSIRDAVVDHVGGLADLKSRILRTVGDADRRFAEDRLRILRGLRFAARFGLTVEERTWQALCSHTLGDLSAERIVQEWDKALCGPGPGRWLDLLATSGHLAALFPPAASPSAEARQDIARALGRVRPGTSLAVRQALWLHTTPLTAAEAWLGTLPGSRRHQEHVCWLLGQPSSTLMASWPLARRRRLLLHPGMADLLELWRSSDPEGGGLVDLEQQAAEERRQGSWSPLVRAQDLIALGCPPGPALGRLLAELADAQLEKTFATREEGLVLARKRLEAADGGLDRNGKSATKR